MSARGLDQDSASEAEATAGEAAAPILSHSFFQGVVESANEGIWIVDLQGVTLFANERMAQMLGTTPAALIGRPPFEYLFPEDLERARELMGRNFAGIPEEFEIRFRRCDGGEIPVLAGSSPIRDEEGRITGSVAMFSDLTARKAAEQREFLLAREVDHRAKNLLAVVQSIVQLTPATDAAELKDSVVGRIQALARAHSLLSESRWDGVDLGQLVAEELAPFGAECSGRVTHGGPPLKLPPAAAQSLALVLHELATNAAKYGPLSDARGALRVEWSRPQDPNAASLEIKWEETGGPPVGTPDPDGFGSKIIRASVERQLRGTVTKEWRREGLLCTLRIPLADVTFGADS